MDRKHSKSCEMFGEKGQEGWEHHKCKTEGKLEKGKMTDVPVKSEFGYHVIKLDDKREKAAPSFDSVKEQIRSVLERKGQAELLEKLRKDAKIERSTEAKIVEPKK